MERSTTLLGKSISKALLLPAATLLCPAAVHVTAVRYWSLGEVTRIAIEVSGEFEDHAERLVKPDRIFFDIPGAKPKLGKGAIHTTQIGDSFVKQIRVAERKPGTTRIVLDIEPQVEFSSSHLRNPDRLMIELRGAPAPLIELREAPAPPISSAPIPATPREPDLSPPPPLKPQVLATAELPRALAGSLPAPRPPERARAARRTSGGGSSLIRALGLKVTRVVIDAGHGGQDQGTVGSSGLKEKDLVLDVAKRLGKLIEERMGSEVIYTRSDDTFVPLEARTELANSKKADLFLSIHANSSRYSRIGGAETYYLNFTTSPDAIDVAARENASSQKSVYELRDILQKITLHDKVEESREFAGHLQSAMYSLSTRSNPSARNRGVKKAPFVVLIGASMPSVLIEIGFLTNQREESLLKRSEHRQRLAEALYRGISRYAQTLSHFQVASAGDTK